MNTSIKSLVVDATKILLMILALSPLVKAGPNSNSVVFNVWEFARVAGPRFTTTSTTTSSPLVSFDVSSSEAQNSISPCVWAITSCCNAQDLNRRNGCFNALGCPGAWFVDLCQKTFQEAALQVISQ